MIDFNATRNTSYVCLTGLTIFVYLFITYKNAFIPGSIAINGILTHFDNNNLLIKFYDIIMNSIYCIICNRNSDSNYYYSKLFFTSLGIVGFLINYLYLYHYVGHNKHLYDIIHVLLCQLPLAVALSYYLHETYS